MELRWSLDVFLVELFIKEKLEVFAKEDLQTIIYSIILTR